MSLDTAALDHICSVVRRSVQEEIKDLSLLFIVHNTGSRARALKDKTDELMAHPGGEALLPLLKTMVKDPDQSSVFAGLSYGDKKSFGGLRKRRVWLAAFFVNSDEFTDQNDARQQAYHDAWHALSVIQRYQGKEMTSITEADGVIRPKSNSVYMARQNLLGDVFAAVILETEGHRKAINALAYKRSLMALQPVPHYKAEQYPFPVAADAVSVVFEEMKDSYSNTGPVALATEIANEIDYTYDDTSIRQWWEFSTAAQEMAWLNFDKNKILGTAIYTSEDPYVRSTAYLVAEALNMEPAALTDLGSYNPFTDQEVNERLHAKACEESFQNVISALAVDFNEHLFLEAVKKQNARLMQGYPIGWCAHAMLMAGDAVENSGGQSHNPIEKARLAFQQGLKEIAWEPLRTLCRLIMHKRRDGEIITPQIIMDFCDGKEALARIAGAFAIVPHEEVTLSTPQPVPGQKPEKKVILGNMLDYANHRGVQKMDEAAAAINPFHAPDKTDE